MLPGTTKMEKLHNIANYRHDARMLRNTAKRCEEWGRHGIADSLREFADELDERANQIDISIYDE